MVGQDLGLLYLRILSFIQFHDGQLTKRMARQQGSYMMAQSLLDFNLYAKPPSLLYEQDCHYITSFLPIVSLPTSLHHPFLFTVRFISYSSSLPSWILFLLTFFTISNLLSYFYLLNYHYQSLVNLNGFLYICYNSQPSK